MKAENIIPNVNIYTDGGAEPNPGKGGFGVIMTYKEHRKEFSAGYLMTTNNRMELMGVIFSLEQLKKPSIINIYSDSKYVIDGITEGWAEKWKSNNWFRTRTQKAANYDLWEKLLNLISIHKSVTFNWIKGHNGHLENERCDQLASLALNSDHLLEDLGYNITTEATNNLEIPLTTINQSNKGKILNVGDSCRKCNTSVIKKNRVKKAIKPNQNYYFAYYLLCPNCKTIYNIEEAKRYCTNNNNQLFS